MAAEILPTGKGVLPNETFHEGELNVNALPFDNTAVTDVTLPTPFCPT